MEEYSSPSFLEKKMNFAKGFPAYRSENSLSLDKKHEQIIGALESSEDWLTSFQESDIRYWSMQDDIGQTPYWMDYFNRNGSKFINLAKFILHKTKYRKENKMVFDSIVDDISIIRHLYGESYLKDNSVDQTPGNPKYSKIHNFKVNYRWMRYLYLANTIKAKDLLPSGGVWVDIGSYYGGLQGVVFKYDQSSKVILVDFHHQLFRSYAYLSEIFPDVKHNLGINETLNEESKGSFNYVHVSDFFALKSLNIDLLTNFFSFGEMQRDVFKNYIDSEVAAKSSTIYTVNRFVSAPFFEKTYNNDLSVLDYQFSSHRLSYFDVFPIHHFAEFSREFFGVTRPRNTSSSYFESIFKRN